MTASERQYLTRARVRCAGQPAPSAARCPVGSGFRFQLVETRIVVRELLQMRPGDLAGKRELVVRDVGLRVPGAVLELDFKAATELLQIDLGPVYPERGADLAGFLYIDLTLSGHDLPPFGGQAGTTRAAGGTGPRRQSDLRS